jgi:hypothetical protein
MPSAPSGLISLPESYLAATIAACAQWQTMTGKDSADAAASIYFDALPAPPNDKDAFGPEQFAELRPFVLIESDEDTGGTIAHAAMGTSFDYMLRGRLKGLIEQRVDPQIAHDNAEVLRRFKNECGALFLQMLDLAGQAGYLAITTLTYRGPLRAHPDLAKDEGDHVALFFTIDWGR